MATRIKDLTHTTALDDNMYFAVDASNEDGKTQAISVYDFKNNMIAQSPFVITKNTQFSKIHYDNFSYIDSGKYTKPYIAAAQCMVFWHIDWDCTGTDGLTLEIIDSDMTLKAEMPIMRDFEGNDSGWMNKNGSIMLDVGMGIRFRGANVFNTRGGNQLTYLVAKQTD